jgi:glucan 1,3-beta-glucosidase
MKLPAILFALVAVVIAAAWTWLGRPVEMPPSPLAAGEKIYCVSYAPFREGQSPGSRDIIPESQIDEDLAKLATLTGCVRTYAVDQGLDKVPALARKHGLKVLQGIWLGRDADRNQIELDTAIRLANEYRDVMAGVVVGNEVLLRGEMSAADLANIIRGVNEKVDVPVTYADVWEFWTRNPVLAGAADFITIHILPYWEDFPIAADKAGAHVDSIKQQVAKVFPGREILIGETGWPSAGRMREQALPSPSEQARVIHDILAVSKAQGYRVNIIEAFDQPWKRVKEGTVGGHWGFLDAGSRNFKFAWGQPVSDHPYWIMQAAGGILLAGLTFAAALFGQRRRYLAPPPGPRVWGAVAIMAAISGTFTGWGIANVPLESLFWPDWVRSIAMVGCGILAPLSVAALMGGQGQIATFPAILTYRDERETDGLALVAGLVLMATTVLTVMIAFGLVFDPRYKDFPFAPLSAAIAPFAVLALASPWISGRWSAAETAIAAFLLLAAVWIGFNETADNWQAMWFCGLCAVLALSLARTRIAVAPG